MWGGSNVIQSQTPVQACNDFLNAHHKLVCNSYFAFFTLFKLFLCLFAQLLAGELGLVSTKITKADKAEHIKRKQHSVQQMATSE